MDRLLVPAAMPKEFADISLTNIIVDFSKSISKDDIRLNAKSWEKIRLDKIFEIKKGTRILNRDMQPGATPCIRATALNNGIIDHIAHPPNHSGNKITVSYNGSIGEAFYQQRDHFSLDDINVLYPKFNLNNILHFLFAL